jgi:hypothetical protein
MAKEHVFYCYQHRNYQLWTGKKWLEFRHGMVITDDSGAAAIKRHPMWGRLFTDIPPDPVVEPHPELRLLDTMILPMDTFDCPECDQVFPSRHQMEMHRRDQHATEEVDDGERSRAEREEEVSSEGPH